MSIWKAPEPKSSAKKPAAHPRIFRATSDSMARNVRLFREERRCHSWPMKSTTSCGIHAPQERTFELFSDLTRLAEPVQAISEVELLTPSASCRAR